MGDEQGGKRRWSDCLFSKIWPKSSTPQFEQVYTMGIPHGTDNFGKHVDSLVTDLGEKLRERGIKVTKKDPETLKDLEEDCVIVLLLSTIGRVGDEIETSIPTTVLEAKGVKPSLGAAPDTSTPSGGDDPAISPVQGSQAQKGKQGQEQEKEEEQEQKEEKEKEGLSDYEVVEEDSTEKTTGEKEPGAAPNQASSSEADAKDTASPHGLGLQKKETQKAEGPSGAAPNQASSSEADAKYTASPQGPGLQKKETQKAEGLSERRIVLLVVQDDEWSRFSKEDLPDSLKNKIDHVFNIHVIPGQSHLHSAQGCRNEEVLKELLKLLEKQPQ